MSLPKKVKLTLDTNPPDIGTKYLEYGFDRIAKLMADTDTDTKYLPRTILLEDLDQSVFDYVPTPYITVRRIDKQAGTRLGKKYRVPQPRKFRYINVPILDEGEEIFLQFRMPEPVNVDMIYEVALFTKYRVDVNKYDEQVLKNFASRQDYVWINGNPLVLLFEGFAESKVTGSLFRNTH